MIYFLLDLQRQFNLLVVDGSPSLGIAHFSRGSCNGGFHELVLCLSSLCFLVLPVLCLFCVYPSQAGNMGCRLASGEFYPSIPNRILS